MPENSLDQNSDIKYFEDNDGNLNGICRNISAGNCVLILGPMFGLNSNNNEVFSEIKKYLIKQDDTILLDGEFQNLFLVEKMDNYNPIQIEDWISQSYEQFADLASLNNSYEKISRIKFSSIINFSQDTFLNNAFDIQKLKYQFSYFSICGTAKEYIKVVEDDEYKNRPYIYNLFGHYKHNGSLIYDYDRFYTFFFSFLGESNIFPPDVVNRLAKARIFLLLGFDLKKWYVPIFIAKLCKIGRENTKDRPMALTSLNNTNKDNQPYVNWLTRFPLQLRFIRDTYSFIDKLMEDPSILNPLNNDPIANPPENENKELSKEEVKYYFDMVAEKSTPEGLLEVISEIKEAFESKRNKEKTLFMISSKATLNSVINKSLAQSIEREAFDVQVNVIRTNLLTYLMSNW
jgi:hypothetical protein